MGFFEKHRAKPPEEQPPQPEDKGEGGGRPTEVQSVTGGKGFHLEAADPRWRLNELILPEPTLEEIREAANTILAAEIIEEWLAGLDKVGRRVAVNFYGPPGTGKTSSAHALAALLNVKVMEVNYAEMESRFVGDTPKNVRAAFRLAQETNALLFFDEADSILSKKFTTLTQANEAYINQTRSTIMLELDKFQGMVVFATNLQRNYDDAFVRRIASHVKFELPDLTLRVRLWRRYMPESLPCAKDVMPERLAELSEQFSPADIATAVRRAAVRAATRAEADRRVTLQDLEAAIKNIHRAKQEVGSKSHAGPSKVEVREITPDQIPPELKTGTSATEDGTSKEK